MFLLSSILNFIIELCVHHDKDTLKQAIYKHIIINWVKASAAKICSLENVTQLNCFFEVSSFSKKHLSFRACNIENNWCLSTHYIKLDTISAKHFCAELIIPILTHNPIKHGFVDV